MLLLHIFISAYKDSARRAKYQIYLKISEPKPIFNLRKQVKGSANRTKKQVYLHFSEVQPNLKPRSELKADLLFRSEDTVARITQSGKDIILLIQALIKRSQVDIYIRMLLLHSLHALR